MQNMFTSFLPRALLNVRWAIEPHPESWGSVSRPRVPSSDCPKDPACRLTTGRSGLLRSAWLGYFLNWMGVGESRRREVRWMTMFSSLKQQYTWIRSKHGIWSHQIVFLEEVCLETGRGDRKLDLPSEGQCGCSEGLTKGTSLGRGHPRLWQSRRAITEPLPERGYWLAYFHEESKSCQPRYSGIWMTTELHLSKLNLGFLLSNQEIAEPDLAGTKDG